MHFNYGIVVLHKGEMVHFCAYPKIPTSEDIHSLWEELNTDPEFGLAGRMHLMEMRPATKAEVLIFSRKIG